MKSVSIVSGQIIIHQLNSLEVADEFIVAIKECMVSGINRPTVRIADSISIFPNAACSVAGLIQFWRTNGVKIKSAESGIALKSTHIISPLRIGSQKSLNGKSVLNKVWAFTSEDEVFRLTNAFVEELFKTDVFEKGALHSLEWSLFEIMDNVINHAKVETGFIMGQIHPESKHIGFCVFDTGQGIYNSLQTYQPRPKTTLDALTLCVKPGVTRGLGQGNGLSGLYEVVRQNKGQLSIWSSGASITLKRGALSTVQDHAFISKEIGCTAVDFQINYDKPISLSDAIKTNGKTYHPVNYRMEEVEDEAGEIVFRLKGKSSGYGTRKAGVKMRNEVINLHKETGQPVVVDFADIAVVASSFADEFIGKLVLEFGFFWFNNLIRLRNMDELVQSIVQKSVSQRMAESLNTP